jgi:photosystem II stability/assembly factor-like uncharacterized protein
MRFVETQKTLLRGVTILAMAWCFAASACAQRWERIGPEGGNVLSLVAAGNGDVLLGTADGHVFASRDNGEHWEVRGRVGTRFDGVVQGLVVDSQGGPRIYAAVWTLDPTAGGGVFISNDGGTTWERAGLQGEAVRALAQSAGRPEVFVAGTRTGVFRSEDAGKNWELISPAGDEELKNLDSIAIDPRDARVIYAGTYHLPWKTTDGGKNWRPIAAGMIDDSDVMSVVIDRGNPDRIFASACSGIYRSENGGVQWTKLQGIPYVSRRTQQIAQDPLNRAVWYAGTTEGLWRSSDDGENWARATGRDVVVNGIAFAGKGERLLLGTEEGILLSSDSGKSFTKKNSGFTHAMVRAFAASDLGSRHLLAAVEKDGNGLLESADGGKSWQEIPAPSMAVNRLFAAGGSWYASLRGGGAAKFDAKAKKWVEMRFVVRETIPMGNKDGTSPVKQTRERFLRPEVSALRAVEGRLFAATSDGLWTNGLRLGMMQRIAERQLSGRVTDLDTNAAGTEIFAIVQNGLMRSIDAGKNWDTVIAGEKLGELLWVRVVNREPQTILVGSHTGVFEFEFGASWKEIQIWKQLQSGLPGAPSWPAALGERFWLIPMKAGGVYMSGDLGDNWERLSLDGIGLVQAIAGTGKDFAWSRTQTDGLFLVKVAAQ